MCIRDRAFLGTAIDKTYPASNAKLRRAIEKSGGAVCSAVSYTHLPTSV